MCFCIVKKHFSAVEGKYVYCMIQLTMTFKINGNILLQGKKRISYASIELQLILPAVIVVV